MVFMFIVTSVALVQLFVKSVADGGYVLSGVTLALFVLSVMFAGQSVRFIFVGKKEFDALNRPV